MVDQRAKGRNGEIKVRDLLRKHTGLKWERVPLSGALDYLKGDLYVPNEKMLYTIEVKNYKDPSIDHLLIHGSPKIFSWWEQACDGATEGQKVALLFRWDRSKIYVMMQDMPEVVDNFLYVSHKNASILLAEDWLTLDKPRFIK